MSRYRKTFREAMAEVELNEVGYLQPRMNDRQLANIKNVWKHKTKKDITPAVKKMIANMDVPTQLAIKHANINLLSDLIEGRMSDIDAMRKQGASAAKIAKELGIDVKAVKAILGEEDSAQDMQDVKKQEKIKEDEDKELEQEFLDDVASNTPNEEQFDEEEKKKKDKEDIAPEHDSNTGEEKSENSKEKLEKEVEKKDQEIAALKQKAETDKAKAIKKDTEKMVNPETGEPLLQIGLAYKHMREKMKKEMQKEEVISEAGITPQMIATLKKEYEPFRNKKITAARAKQLMNILDKFKEADLQKLGKENIPFISSGSRSKLAVRNMKFTVKNIQFGEEMDEEMFEACWTGYKQVGLKDKGGKKVPNCVPEETILEKVNEMAKDKAYAIGMSVAKKKYNDEPPLDKKTITKGHEIADKLLKKEEVYLSEKEITKLKNGVKVLGNALPNRMVAQKAADKANREMGHNADVYQSPFNNRFYVRIKEDINEADDHEISMARGELEAISDKALKLSSILQGKTDKDNIEAWVQSKITKAKDYINSVADYMEYNPDMANEETLKEFTTQQIKMAYGVANDKRYKGGNYSGAVKAIEKIAKGLSKHPDVLKVLKRTNENAPSVADINRLKKQGLKPKKEDHPAREVYESIAAVRKKAEKSGMPYGVLKKVYDRGMAAWRGGHRPGATQVQWALARVNSFVTKSSGTWGGADKDLAKQVRGK